MDIVLSYDQSVDSAPQGFKTALSAAVQFLDTTILNPITVTISVGWGEINGSPLPDGAAATGEFDSAATLSYAALVADLRTDPTSSADEAALGALPANDPTGGYTFQLPDAEAQALGLLPAAGTGGVEGSIGFETSFPFDYATDGTTEAGEANFVGVAINELTHAMGRAASLPPTTLSYSPLDLFRYVAPGDLALVSGDAAYFSLDGGYSDLDEFAVATDQADWTHLNGPDAFDVGGQQGNTLPFSATDAEVMQALGFTVACFAAGTRIATVRGPVAVEALRVGDLAIAHRSGVAPVIWLGSRRVACSRHPQPHDVWPVRVRAGAFGPGLPARDLLLSPDHAVLANGALIPIRYLANGASIVQERCGQVEYWHVELPRHDVLLAEGLAAESFLDTGNRAAFFGTAPTARVRPDMARKIWRQKGCAPLLTSGPRVRAAHRRLLARAVRLGHTATEDSGLTVLAGGRPLAMQTDGARHRVRLPAETARLRLSTRTWTPSHLEPESDDSRVLGVALRRLWLDGRAASLDSPALGDGWHAVEADWRWTNGDAEMAVAGAREVAFEVGLVGRYWVEKPDLWSRRGVGFGRSIGLHPTL